ncbi:MAG: hypothetical protein ACPLPW_02455 [bacterium]
MRVRMVKKEFKKTNKTVKRGLLALILLLVLLISSCTEPGSPTIFPTLTPPGSTASPLPSFSPSPTPSPTQPPFVLPSPTLTPLEQIYNAKPELEVNRLVWKVEKATFTKDLPKGYNAPSVPRGKYLILELSTRSLSWDARPPDWRQLVLLDQNKNVYYPVASHGFFLSLLDPERIKTLIDPSAPPYQSTAVFDVKENAQEFVLGIKRAGFKVEPEGYLIVPEPQWWP